MPDIGFAIKKGGGGGGGRGEKSSAPTRKAYLRTEELNLNPTLAN